LVLVALAGDPRINAVIGDASWTSPRPPASEVERIRTHLAYVDHLLRARHSPARDAALATLERYLARGEVPRRTDDAYAGRRPRFIDDRGVRCAVGEMIWDSGDPALALALDRDHEYAYVRDMHSPALAAWADAHDFTLDELAMIQPAYTAPPNRVSTQRGIEAAKDELVLAGAGESARPAKLAIHVAGLERGNIVVTSTANTPFARCFTARAPAAARTGGAWRHAPETYELDMILALATPRQQLER